MPIDLTCPCGKRLRVADSFAGGQGRCPACDRVLEIPEQNPLASGAGPFPLEETEAVSSTPGLAGPAESGAPEDAVTALPPEPSEPLPDQSDEVGRPRYKLFSPGSIGLVAFLTGPVGAFILLTLNYWRLGKRGAAWTTVAFALLTMVAIFVISVVVPESFPTFLLGIPVFLILLVAARVLQGGAYDSHLRSGGESASGWAAAGIAVLGIVLYFAVFLGIFLMYDLYLHKSFGQKIAYAGGEEVYYGNGATEADGRALGTFLRDSGYFDGRAPKSVRVSLDGNRLVISFVVQDWALRDPQIQEQFRIIGQQASQRAFGGRPVVVELCDQYFKAKKTL
jgi:hypothetical protein